MKPTIQRFMDNFSRLTNYFKVNMDDVEERRSFYLLIEIVFAYILSAAATFVSTYALRLGATNAHIGLLSSLPSLMAILLSIPFGRFLQTRKEPLKWMIPSLGLHRLGYSFLALVPFIALSFVPQGLLVVIIVVLVNIPAHLWNIGSMSFMMAAIPPERRANVISARNMAAAATAAILVFLFGLYLNAVVFPINYQLMFLVAGLASNISTYFLVKMNVGAISKPPEEPEGGKKTFIGQFRDLFRLLKERPIFSKFVVNTLLQSLGFWIAGPLYVIFYVRQLGASDAWIGYSATVANIAALIGWYISRKIANKWGECTLLKRSMFVHAFYPLLIGLVPALTPILIIIFLDNVIAPSVSLTHYNTLLHILPKERAQDASGLWSTIMNAVAFVCPLLGVALADWVGVQPVLIGCGILTIVGSLSFWKWQTPAQPLD